MLSLVVVQCLKPYLAYTTVTSAIYLNIKISPQENVQYRE